MTGRVPSFLAVICFGASACGGVASTTVDPVSGPITSVDPNDPRHADKSGPDQTATGTPPARPDASIPPTAKPSSDAGACATDTSPPPRVLPGGTISPRPAGTVLRFNLTYRGESVAVRTLNGVDMVLGPSDGPFVGGQNSGYWVELQDSSGHPRFTRLFYDPTLQESPGPNGGFINGQIPECTAKSISVDLPNDPRGTKIVIFGTGYPGTAAAHELGHFDLP